MYKETFIINGTIYHIGDHISCEILNSDGKSLKIKDARLNREDQFFFLCQNVVQGLDCINKLGYRYSYAVHSTEFEMFNIKKLNKNCFDDILAIAFPKR